jgi:hypothetical protein
VDNSILEKLNLVPKPTKELVVAGFIENLKNHIEISLSEPEVKTIIDSIQKEIPFELIPIKSGDYSP